MENSVKLFKHLDRLNEWITTGDAFPIMVSIDLTNACNNFCPHCMGVRPDANSIPFEKVKEIIIEAKELGTKSIGLGGGGDPSVHPKITEIIEFIHEQGLEVGMFSNCFRLPDKLMSIIINYCTYLRVSLDAGSAEIYKQTHGMDEKAFNKVIENIKKMNKMRKELNKPIVIGAGFLVGPHTLDGIYPAAKLYKEIGLDYIRIRPFFDGFGIKRLNEGEQKKAEIEFKRCLELKDSSFNVTYPAHRIEWMGDYTRVRPFKKCNIHFFETVITANQEVYPCCHLSGIKKYCFGSLKGQSLKELWHSERRREAYKGIDFTDCPNPCSLDSHNKILWDIEKPIAHSNFL